MLVFFLVRRKIFFAPKFGRSVCCACRRVECEQVGHVVASARQLGYFVCLQRFLLSLQQRSQLVEVALLAAQAALVALIQ